VNRRGFPIYKPCTKGSSEEKVVRFFHKPSDEEEINEEHNQIQSTFSAYSAVSSNPMLSSIVHGKYAFKQFPWKHLLG
jgi:hypothetical protein